MHVGMGGQFFFFKIPCLAALLAAAALRGTSGVTPVSRWFYTGNTRKHLRHGKRRHHKNWKMSKESENMEIEHT